MGDYESFFKYWFNAADEEDAMLLFYGSEFVVDGFYFEVINLSLALFMTLYLNEEFTAPVAKDES